MKCLSLWQPWSSALFVTLSDGKQLKPDETRPWFSRHTGPLAIHAAQKRTRPGVDYDPALMPIIEAVFPGGMRAIPYGCILGVVFQTACLPAPYAVPLRDSAQLLWGDYRRVGDDGKGRFAHVFQQPKLLPEPIPWKGKQGYFEVPDELFKKCGNGLLSTGTDLGPLFR